MESDGNAAQHEHWKGSKGKAKLVPAENSTLLKAPFSPKIRHVAGFTNLIKPRQPPQPASIYSRSLFPAGNGYPLWIPTSVTSLPVGYKQRGICIGDVGVLVGNGDFSFVFNIFQPRDHPVHKNRGLPSGFVPLEPLDPSEVQAIPNHFPPDSVIVSKGVEVSFEPESLDEPARILFKSSEPEASILILPTGASRQDVLTTRIRQYVEKHALDWFRYFDYHANMGFAMPNGTIYVVTGHDKARSCTMSTFPDIFSQGLREMTAEYYYDNDKFISDPKASCKILDPLPDNGENRCVFLRGIRVALGPNDWIEQFDDLPEFMTPFSVIPPTPSAAEPGLRSDQKSLISTSSRSSHNPESSRSSKESETMYVQQHPFHPSDIIGQIMLFQRPESSLALIDDHIWSVLSLPGKDLIAKNSRLFTVFQCANGAFIYDFTQLISQIFSFHNILNSGGTLTLVPDTKTKNQDKPWLRKLRRLFTKDEKNSKQETFNWMDDLVFDLVLQGEDVMDDNYHLSPWT